MSPDWTDNALALRLYSLSKQDRTRTDAARNGLHMNRKYKGVIGGSLLTAVLGLASSAQANLIINGGFEAGNFSPNATDPGVMILPSGSTAISGWTVQNVLGGDITWEQSSDVSPGNPWLLKSSEGSKFIDLTGYANDSSVIKGGIFLSQTISTAANQKYRLTFDLGSSAYYDGASGANPSVLVSVNGTPTPLLFTGNVNATDLPGFRDHWQKQTYQFTSFGGPSTISFVAVTPGTDHVILLDNVNLTAVPETNTVLAGVLLLLPLGVSTARILRRRPRS